MWAALGKLLTSAVKRKAKKTLVGAAQGDEASKRKIVIAALIAFLMTIIPFLLFAFIIFGPILLTEQFIDDYDRERTLFFSKVGNFLTLKGWCSDMDGSCEQKAEQKYLNEINDVYRDYQKKGVEINTDLITGTIFYGYDSNGYLYDIDEDGINQSFVKKYCDANTGFWIGEKACELYVKENFEEIYSKNEEKYLKIATNYEYIRKEKCEGNNSKISSLTKTSISPVSTFNNETVEEFCEFYLWNFADLDDVSVDDDTIGIIYRYGVDDIESLAKNMVSSGEIDYDKYRKYLIKTYIPKRFKDIYESADDKEKAKEKIADEIMLFANERFAESGSTCNVVNTSCSGVNISGGNHAGTYTLEEYVAGVLSHEVGTGWPDEALKAQAVAARTFVLNYTDNCTKSIPNSTNAQTFSPTTDERLIKAANDTAGVVLTVDDKVFSSEYASWWGNNSSSSCGSYQNCSNGQCSIDLYKLPNNEKWTFSMPQNYFAWGDVTNNIQMSDGAIQGLGGHCRGMSQFGAKYLDLGEHYQYDKILNTFYSPNVKISTFGNSTNTCSPGLVANGIVGSNYKNFMQRVSAPTGSDYYYSQDYFYSGNVGQCVWYVQRRALEIMNTVDIDEELRQKAVTALLNTGGNGRDWWDNPSLTMFGYSTDYSQPKVGSIIVWRYTQANINNHNGYDYGHVAIVEAVDYENKTMTVSDGWKNDWSKPNSIEYASFGFRTVPFEWALNAGNPNNYIFMGYVYLLD